MPRRATAAAAAVVAPLLLAGAPELAFTGPEVAKLDWNTRSLQVFDLDGDGLHDLAVINNDAGKIELLLQSAGDAAGARERRVARDRWEPVLEDARFERQSVAVGSSLFDLAVADFDGDGLGDLAYTSNEEPLTLRLQGDSGLWLETRVFDDVVALGWNGTLAAGDIDGDERPEIVLLAEGELVIVRDCADIDAAVSERYPLTGENPFNLMLVDVHGDGRPDILYLASNGSQSLVLREQNPEGGFGPEVRFGFESPVRSVRPLPGYPADRPVFGAVQSRTGVIELFHLERVREAAADSLRPDVYPLYHDSREPARYALGDFDGDGTRDLAVANPGEPEVLLFAGDGGGFAAPRSFPSFSGVSALRGGRFDGRNSLVVLSVDEKSLGVCDYDAGGRLSFPEPVDFGDGEPLAVAVCDPDRDGTDELAVVVEDGDVRLLRLLAAGADGWELRAESELPADGRAPSDLVPVDLFGDRSAGLMLFVPRGESLLMRSDPSEPFAFRSFAADSPVRRNLLKDLEPAQVSVFDTDGDGVGELVLGRSGFARVLRVAGDDLEMVDQYNSRGPDDPVDAVIPLGDASGAPSRMLLYSADSGEFQRLEPDGSGVYRYRSAVDVGRIEVVGWERAWHAGEAFALLGRDRFWLVRPDDAQRWARVVIDSHETDLEDFAANFMAGSPAADGDRYHLFVVDAREHLIEILEAGGETWRSLLYWRIFEESLNYQGRRGTALEPREIVVADLTGDGLEDFALLVHDRVLVYPRAGDG